MKKNGVKAVIPSRLVIKGFVLAFLFTVVILAGLVWYTWRSNRHLKMLETTHFRLLQLSGQIVHIDEVLTMSAHMAVETGEPEWEYRYRNFEPLLESAIKEVIELSPEQFMKEAISRTDTANIKLVTMENQAFDLIGQGDVETAKKVLHGTEYTKQKQIYSNGINEISDAIRIRERARIKQEQQIAFTVIVLLVITIPLVAFIWFAALRILRRYIVERKQAELALRLAEQRFRAIADYSYFWEVWVSPGGNPVWTNPAVEQVTGYCAEELMGMRDYPMALVYEEDREKVDKAFKSALEGSTGREMDYRLLRKDGSIVWVETAWQPIFDDKGVSQGHRVSIHDITARKHAEEARYKLTLELEAKNKELESILYAASHDLKSPLVNLQGFSYELSQSCDLIRSALKSKEQASEKEKEVDVALNENIPNALGFIMASTAKMDSLLSGLLDVSRLNAAAVDAKRIDMNAMMSNIVESMEYQLKESGATIDIEPLVSCVGDPLQINRVFTNLLTNSSKFFDDSRPGTIRIYSQSQDEKIIYCVEDNGIGIAREHQEKIFQIFYQHEPDKREGEGIGLTIVRQIIEKHDGEVWVESEQGKGSKFLVSLPS